MSVAKTIFVPGVFELIAYNTVRDNWGLNHFPPEFCTEHKKPIFNTKKISAAHALSHRIIRPYIYSCSTRQLGVNPFLLEFCTEI